jgi:hypothetical protein
LEYNDSMEQSSISRNGSLKTYYKPKDCLAISTEVPFMTLRTRMMLDNGMSEIILLIIYSPLQVSKLFLAL